jgi:hypothetical protein
MSINIPLILSVTFGMGSPPPAAVPYPSAYPPSPYPPGPAHYEPAAELRRVDLNRDGQISLWEAEDHGRREFHAHDRNRDGLLSRREYPRGEEAFRWADRDGDHRVTHYEHQAAVRARFMRLDMNRDGVLTAYETGAIPHDRQRTAGRW